MQLDNWLGSGPKDLVALRKVAAPHVLLLSAVFRTLPGPKCAEDADKRRNDRRATVEMVPYPAAKGFKVVQHAGKWLDQGDLDVWLKLLDMARLAADGAIDGKIRLLFGSREFLRQLGRPQGGSDVEQLQQSLYRLWLARVELISPQGARVLTGFIDTVLEHDDFELYGVSINAECAALYRDRTWAALDFQHRLAFKKDALAKWLHGELSAHKLPLARSLAYFVTLSGRSGRPNELKSAFKLALAKVARVTGWACQIETTGEYKGKITCYKNPAQIARLKKDVKPLSALDRLMFEHRKEIRRLDKQRQQCQTRMSAEQLLAARAIQSAAEAMAPVRCDDGTLHPVSARKLWLEVDLCVMDCPAQFPDLRAHVDAAQAALRHALPA